MSCVECAVEDPLLRFIMGHCERLSTSDKPHTPSDIVTCAHDSSDTMQ